MGVVSTGKLTQCQMGPIKLISDNVTACLSSQIFLTSSQPERKFFMIQQGWLGGEILVQVNICING